MVVKGTSQDDSATQRARSQKKENGCIKVGLKRRSGGGGGEVPSGREPAPLALGEQGLNHWTTREVPEMVMEVPGTWEPKGLSGLPDSPR